MPQIAQFFKTFIPRAKGRLKRSIGYPPVDELSYSAAGEDRLVLAWLQVVYHLYNSSEVRYCDIGASHPKRLNNTYAIYLRGGSGVLVEPDPALIKDLKKERPRDVVLNVGVAFDDSRSAKLKRFTNSVFNTFSSDQANVVLEGSKNWAPHQLQQVVDEIEVPLVPINEILAQHFSSGIHFLSIDAEGVDFSILKSVDFARFKPKMICIEMSRSVIDINTILNPRGYELLAQTPDNAIYRLV